MNKSNITLALAALSAVLLGIVVVRQSNQAAAISSLRHDQNSIASATAHHEQQARNDIAKLALQVAAVGTNLDSNLTKGARHTTAAMSELGEKVLALGTNWEAELTPRLSARADEIVAVFSARLNQKASEATTALLTAMRQQAEAALRSTAIDHSNKTAQLLHAAGAYEQARRPELAELCYLSALRSSDGNPGPALKPMLAWQERRFQAMSDGDCLTKGPATLVSIYEALDKILPDSSATAEDMEAALAATDRIQARIIERQQARLADIRGTFAWDKFSADSLTNYERSKVILASVSPANTQIDSAKTELLETADNLIQSAHAINSFSTAVVLPPAYKAPPKVATHWLECGLAFIASPTNATQSKLAALPVLLNFAQARTDIPTCQAYAQTFTNESISLAAAQWTERVNTFGTLADAKNKPYAETLAVGQSLLNQGLALLSSFAFTDLTTEVSADLPRLASRLYWTREQLLVAQMRLVEAPGAFSSKEQAARARSMLYGQILGAALDAKTLEAELHRQCHASPDSFSTLKSVQKRFGEYLVAYDQFDKADAEEAKSLQLAKQRQQLQRYAEHCKGIIQSASAHYDAAESAKSGIRTYSAEPEYLAKWSNQRPQRELKEGLKLLYSIDANDLRQADPGLANLWDATNEKLKKNLTDKETAAPALDAQTRKSSKFDF